MRAVKNHSGVFALILLILMTMSSSENKQIGTKLDGLRRTQVRINNDANEPRSIRLWGGFNDVPICAANMNSLTDLEVTQTIAAGVGVTLGKLIYNPFNDLIYVLNTNGSVLFYTTDGLLVGSVGLPLGSLPSDLVVYSNTTSANYGRVYVSNTGSNSITVIDTSLTVLTTINVGSTPVSLALDLSSERLYTANSGSNNVQMIDLLTNTNLGGFSSPTPQVIAVNPTNGDIYVGGSPGFLRIYTSSFTLITTLALVDNTISDIAYNPVNNQMYVATTGASLLTPIDTVSYMMGTAIALSAVPVAIVFNPNNDLLIVGTTSGSTYVAIDSTNMIVSEVSLHPFGDGLTIDPLANILWASSSVTNTIVSVEYATLCTDISIDTDYLEKVENFNYNPVKVEHIRFAFSTINRFNTLRLCQQSITGKTSQRVVSMGDYVSVSHKQPVVDLYGLNGVYIDGQNSWLFEIAPMQVITIVMHYRQLRRIV